MGLYGMDSWIWSRDRFWRYFDVFDSSIFGRFWFGKLYRSGDCNWYGENGVNLGKFGLKLEYDLVILHNNSLVFITVLSLPHLLVWDWTGVISSFL